MKRRSSIDEFLALALEDAMKGIEKGWRRPLRGGRRTGTAPSFRGLI